MVIIIWFNDPILPDILVGLIDIRYVGTMTPDMPIMIPCKNRVNASWNTLRLMSWEMNSTIKAKSQYIKSLF